MGLPYLPKNPNFWTKARLLCRTQTPDIVNDDIWRSSVAIHSQPSFQANLLRLPGSVGAQQAMLDPVVHPWPSVGVVAPWVPDVLGEDWTHPNAIFVVGSALAGFIKDYSGRHHVMDLNDYLGAQDWQAFQKTFVRDVVVGDSDHYERLCPLINHQTRFAVFDVVRCSLVVRGALKAGTRQDGNINTRLLNHRPVFSQYGESLESKKWTMKRLMGTRARLIVALGFTAEYSLVRFFTDIGMRVRDSLTRKAWKQPRLKDPSNWTYGYPGGSTHRSLVKRYAPPSWWEIEDPATGNPRWAIVPVVHPSSWGEDPGYRQSRKLIAAARRRIRHWPVV